MKKIIQISSCAASNGHSLYVLTEDGKVYERRYNQDVDGLCCDIWQEIEESTIKPENSLPF